MAEQTVLFPEPIDIPEAHMKAFIVCNSSPTQTFYLLKDKILTKYGHRNDYDLQTIKQTCNSCDGTGKFKCHWKHTETCWSCLGDGVFRIKKIILERWLINGNLFHKPLGEFIYTPFSGIIKNEIQGYIRHERVEGNPHYCLYYLMWNYDRDMFFKYLTSDVQCYYKRERLKFQRLLRKHNPLTAIAEFLKVKKQETDDLPF
ncbi:MAG: hypothetical protein BWY67_00738 [Bacteroidetes bacterium ADurb.Bin397]|nr:MAG: hypothetical protein BWY67_00738 [Bacteroidetes bacterium ADurb.Bin397]